MTNFKKVPSILVATHGTFCKELIQTVGLLYGEMADVEALPLLPGVSQEEYQEEMEKALDRYDGDVLIFVDILGGTPFNTVMKIGRNRPLCAVAGVNANMLLEALDIRDTERDGAALAEHIEKVAKSSVKNFTPELTRFYELTQAQGR